MCDVRRGGRRAARLAQLRTLQQVRCVLRSQRRGTSAALYGATSADLDPAPPCSDVQTGQQHRLVCSAIVPNSVITAGGITGRALASRRTGFRSGRAAPGSARHVQLPAGWSSGLPTRLIIILLQPLKNTLTCRNECNDVVRLTMLIPQNLTCCVRASISSIMAQHRLKTQPPECICPQDKPDRGGGQGAAGSRPAAAAAGRHAVRPRALQASERRIGSTKRQAGAAEAWQEASATGPEGATNRAVGR